MPQPSQDPEGLPGCSPQSVQASGLEFHTVIFVLKDTMACPQDYYQGLRFHRLLPHKKKQPFALTLTSAPWFYCCISEPPFLRLTLVACLIVRQVFFI